ncbi:MAG: glycosyltransferase family 4 protein [Gammaproteobacteria bacterium]
MLGLTVNGAESMLPRSAVAPMLGSSAAKARRRPLKLCVLLPNHWSKYKGGSEYQAMVLVDYLLKEYDVQITYLTTECDPEFVPPNYRLVRFSAKRGIRRYGLFFDLFRLYGALKREAPDVIYQQVASAHTGIAAFYAKRRKCRMVWRLASDSDIAPGRSSWLQPHRIIERWFLRYGILNADVIAAQTKHQQRLLADRFGRSDTVVVRNFHPAPTAPVVNAAGSKRTIVWIGNIKPLKGPEVFIRLAARFAQRVDVEFVMIGAPMGKESWLAEISSMSAALPNFRRLGELSQDEVNAVLCHSYALVNTSDYEGFSNTFIQSWMRGVPVVSLAVNPDGLFDAQGIGLVSGSEQQLYADISKLLDDPDLVRAMGQRARAFALQEFSENNIGHIAQMLGLEQRGELTCAE